MFHNSRNLNNVPEGFVSVRQHNRTVIVLVAVCCLSIGIAIGAVVRGTAGAKGDDNHLTITETTVNPDELSAAFAKAASRVEPCVVHIGVTDDQSIASFAHEDTGSGIIVNSAGYILTNQHVVEHPSKIKVKLSNGDEYDAKIVGEDPETDLAVLKIDSHETLPAAVMGNSDKMRVGDWVLAIGSPFGYDQTVTAGIISAKDRVTDQKYFFRQFLQTDAAINPGNSGGPLVNLAGEVVGINSLIVTTTWVYNGIGFALPSSTAVDIYNQLIQYARVRRGFLGIELQRLTDEVAHENNLADTQGVQVKSIIAKEGPAARAGIHIGDIITAIDGKKVKDVGDLVRKVAALPVGSFARVTFVRYGQQYNVSVKLDDRTSVLVDGSTKAGTPDSGPPRMTRTAPNSSGPSTGSTPERSGQASKPMNDKERTADDSSLNPAFGMTVESLSRDKAKKLGMDGA
ncbi:MAG TPA: trypsin-like peptidase domain-containing protein, partial [Blastocatellia bacterium]|nr:trypsin-like peptidase domain-containing protein [Blastocatellia bacterium]